MHGFWLSFIFDTFLFVVEQFVLMLSYYMEVVNISTERISCYHTPMKKNPIKKLKLPLKKMTTEQKDYVAVLLEDVNSNMKAFWEVLQGTKDDVKALDKKLDRKVDAVYEQIAGMSEKITSIEFEIKAIKKQMVKLSGHVELLESRISAVEKQLVEIKNELSVLKGRAEPVLQKRVEYLEVHVKTLEIALSNLKSAA